MSSQGNIPGTSVTVISPIFFKVQTSITSYVQDLTTMPSAFKDDVLLRFNLIDSFETLFISAEFAKANEHISMNAKDNKNFFIVLK